MEDGDCFMDTISFLLQGLQNNVYRVRFSYVIMKMELICSTFQLIYLALFKSNTIWYMYSLMYVKIIVQLKQSLFSH